MYKFFEITREGLKDEKWDKNTVELPLYNTDTFHDMPFT